jgi:hypothetical protein
MEVCTVNTEDLTVRCLPLVSSPSSISQFLFAFLPNSLVVQSSKLNKILRRLSVLNIEDFTDVDLRRFRFAERSRTLFERWTAAEKKRVKVVEALRSL